MQSEWRKLRADELRQRAAANAIVILPIGSIEQHGPHLPVETDSTLGETIAIRVATELTARGEPALTLPMLWTGISEHHMSFGGTITLDLATFCAVVTNICTALVRHGFKRIVLLNSHGGNDNAMRSLADDLTPRLGVPIIQFTYWYAAAQPIADILDTQDKLLHACEAETSMMMAVRPELVAADRIPLAARNNADPDEPMPDGVYRWRAIGSRARSGVIGNPHAASAEKGHRLFDAIVAHACTILSNPTLWTTPYQAGPPDTAI